MKKLFIISVLMALVINGFTQNQYDFSSVCETGQTLFYRITDAETHTVTLTHPCSENDPGFEGDYYGYHPHPEGVIVIPSEVTYNGIDYSVTAIDSRSFWDCLITSIFIPNSVNNIVPGAFSSCEFLESISMDEENPTYYSENNTIIRREDNALVVGCKASIIPEDIEIICRNAFFCMGSSGVLTIPNSVRIIEEYAFAYNHFSGSLTLPESLETIGAMAFYVGGFSGSLTMPNSVTEIGHHAFYGCHFSGSLTLSSSLSTIENCAFARCHFSGTLVIPNSVSLIVGAAFTENDFSELVLGESVTTIESIAFSDCTNLTGTLRLPASLTLIDQMAFINTSFNEIYSPNRLPPTLASNAFQGYDPNIPIHIPFGCTEAYQNAEGWNYFTNFIEEEPIIFTIFEPDTCFTLNYQDTIYWDLNQDGNQDIYFYLVWNSAGGYMTFMKPKANWKWSNSIKIDQTHFQPLTYTTTIDESLYWEAGDSFINGYEEPEWWHFAFRHQAEDGIHYGWAHIKNAGYRQFCISGMGYCTIPNYPIVWGQTNITEGMEEETIENDFSVYPNPANGVLFVQTRHGTSLPDPTYRITNIMGQTLLSGNITDETQQVNLESLPAGMYFITFAGETRKFVVR